MFTGDSARPEVVDFNADAHFRRKAQEMNLDPDDAWVGGYVDNVWNTTRHAMSQYLDSIREQPVLEFGCNIGASSIVLQHLGGRVVGIDVDSGMVDLARANAARFGVNRDIEFMCVQDTTRLPFADDTFTFVSANSVFEYVSHRDLPVILKELARVTTCGGLVYISGTSNRVWPKEVHSRRWLVNYLPCWIDRVLPKGWHYERGVSPWVLARGFPGWINLDMQDDMQAYFAAKGLMGTSPAKLKLLRAVSHITGLFGITIGWITPSICVTLKKPKA